MADENPSQPGKGEAKTVPLEDLIRVKRSAEAREKALKAERDQLKEALAQAQSELQIRGVDVDDEEDVGKVKKYLLEQDKAIKKERAKFNAELAGFEEERKAARIQSLAGKYSLNVEDISGEEDPEKKALELYVERLSQEKEELVKNPKPAQSKGSVFESGTRGVVKVSPKDMTPEEFNSHVKRLKEEALSR